MLLAWLAPAPSSVSCLLIGHLMARQAQWGGRRRVQAGLTGSARCPPQVAYFQSALDKLNEAIKLAKVKLRRGLAAPRP